MAETLDIRLMAMEIARDVALEAVAGDAEEFDGDKFIQQFLEKYETVYLGVLAVEEKRRKS